jgi:hypothetical protein
VGSSRGVVRIASPCGRKPCDQTGELRAEASHRVWVARVSPPGTCVCCQSCMFGGALEVGDALLSEDVVEVGVHMATRAVRLVDAAKLDVSRAAAIGQLPDLAP